MSKRGDVRIRRANNGFICTFEMYDEKEDEVYDQDMIYEFDPESRKAVEKAMQKVVIAMARYFDIVDDNQYNDMKKRLEVVDYGIDEQVEAKDKPKARRKAGAR